MGSGLVISHDLAAGDSTKGIKLGSETLLIPVVYREEPKQDQLALVLTYHTP